MSCSRQPLPENNQNIAQVMGKFEFPTCWIQDHVNTNRIKVQEQLAKYGQMKDSKGLVLQAYHQASVEQLLSMDPLDFSLTKYPDNIEVSVLPVWVVCSPFSAKPLINVKILSMPRSSCARLFTVPPSHRTQSSDLTIDRMPSLSGAAPTVLSATVYY